MQHIVGIYKITNIVNNKIYIGSSNDVFKRKREHISALKNNTHCNIHLQRAYNYYGEDSFIFEVIELCEEGNLLEVEQKYLDKYFDDGINCYNENPIANKPPSRKGCEPWNKNKQNVYSKETLIKLRNSKIGIPCSEEIKQKLRETAKNKTFKTAKLVICVESNIVYKSINEASRQTNIDRKNITKCCNKQRKTAGGYHWEFFNSTIHF